MAKSLIVLLGITGSLDVDFSKVKVNTTTLQVMEDWGNELIKDLIASMEAEISQGTSKDLQQSMKATPTEEKDGLKLTISMLDYYDYTNKGVEGLGGVKANGEIYLKKPTLGVYRFKTSPIKLDKSLRDWASGKGISVYPLRYSIAHTGIEGKMWYDNVVTEERIRTLSEEVAKVSGDNLAVVLKTILQSSEFKRK